MSEIRVTSILDNPLPIEVVSHRMPQWGWPRSRLRSTAVPSETAAELRHLLTPVGTREPPVVPPDDDRDPPARIQYTSERVVRNTSKGDKLKRLYKGKCQVCGHSIPVPGQDQAYAEVHHMRPLGRKHQGRDNWNNMLVLCPNCHAEFDLLAAAIDVKNGGVVGHTDAPREKRRRMRFTPGHALDKANIGYHWRRFCKAGGK